MHCHSRPLVACFRPLQNKGGIHRTFTCLSRLLITSRLVPPFSKVSGPSVDETVDETPVRPTINLHIDGPFYVGIGFCSQLPDKSDTAMLSNVVLENSAGKVR
jgi:hypothetical protein